MNGQFSREQDPVRLCQAHLIVCASGRTRCSRTVRGLRSLLGMTERTFVAIPAACIGEVVEVTPNMLLALVGLGIRRFAPAAFLGLAFTLACALALLCGSTGAASPGFPFPLLGFPPVEGAAGLAGAARRSFPSSIWRKPIWVCVRLDCSRRLMMVR